MQVKYKNFAFYRLLFVLKLVSSSYDSIPLSQIIAESSIIIVKFIPFSQLHAAGFQTIFFTYMSFLHSHQHFSLFHHGPELYFLPSNLHLHSHDICFVNVFD